MARARRPTHFRPPDRGGPPIPGTSSSPRCRTTCGRPWARFSCGSSSCAATRSTPGPPVRRRRSSAGVRDLRDMVLRFLDMAQVLSRTMQPRMGSRRSRGGGRRGPGDGKGEREDEGRAPGERGRRRRSLRCVQIAAACSAASSAWSPTPCSPRPSGGTVEVRVEGAGDRVLFRVRDSGPGMEATRPPRSAESLAAGTAPTAAGSGSPSPSASLGCTGARCVRPARGRAAAPCSPSSCRSRPRPRSPDGGTR